MTTSPASTWSRRKHHVDELFLLAHIVAIAAVAPWLARLPLPRLADVLEPSKPRPTPDPASEARAVRLLGLVLGHARPRPTCLTRGITSYYVLRRLGLDVALAFGVGQAVAGTLAGHCWLERDGAPFLERNDPRPIFVETYRIAPRPC